MRRRITISRIGELAVVSLNENKIVDSDNIEQLGQEFFSLIDVDKLKVVKSISVGRFPWGIVARE